MDCTVSVIQSIRWSFLFSEYVAITTYLRTRTVNAEASGNHFSGTVSQIDLQNNMNATQLVDCLHVMRDRRRSSLKMLRVGHRKPCSCPWLVSTDIKKKVLNTVVLVQVRNSQFEMPWCASAARPHRQGHTWF
jgi:hypothetical protein